MAVKLFNGYQLMTVYFKTNDYDRIVKFYDQELSDIIKKIKDKKDIGETQNHILHIESILADSLMMLANHRRANKVFYNLCKYYNHAKVKNQDKFKDVKVNSPEMHEFGVDEYIRVKASYAECIMNLGQT